MKFLLGKYRLNSAVRILLVIIAGWVAANTSFSKDYNSGIIESDAKGYYAYLPAIFIYHDLNFRFYYHVERETYNNPQFYSQYLRVHNDKTINKYYAGTALCLVPFFLVGHVVTLLSDYPADGYSYYYTMFAHLGALFWLWLGIAGMQKLLRAFNFGEKVIALVSMAIVLGTNLLYYVITEFAMSHLYSFTAIAWFCYFVKEYFATRKNTLLVFAGLLLGLICLIRPVNVVIVLSVPFLAGSGKNLIEGIRLLFKQIWLLPATLAGFLLVAGIQLLIYKLQTGDWLVYSYPGEYFNFAEPHIREFLFSYRKGVFVYVPILLLSLAGFFYLWKQSGTWILTLASFMMITVYVFSSWHMWYYGGSFGQRVMIDFYWLFAVLLAAVFQFAKPAWLQRVCIAISVVCILFCQVQTYQYRHMIIHWSDMDRAAYWNVFLKIK